MTLVLNTYWVKYQSSRSDTVETLLVDALTASDAVTQVRTAYPRWTLFGVGPWDRALHVELGELTFGAGVS